MKIPGTIKALAEQLEAVGWGIPSELRFDAEGQLVGVTLRPAPPAPAASSSPASPRGPRRSPSEMFLGGPQ